LDPVAAVQEHDPQRNRILCFILHVDQGIDKVDSKRDET
jgi:hypothetical protein